MLGLVGAPGGVNDGGNLDPENLILGPAWASGAAVRKPINTMWLSSTAVGAFIDAKASTHQRPALLDHPGRVHGGRRHRRHHLGPPPDLGPGARRHRHRRPRRPVRPASAGPRTARTRSRSTSRRKAGRDVALVGILWFAPMYPTAFTAYALAS